MSDRVGNTMKAVMPEQPRVGSVVIDGKGRAWQLRGGLGQIVTGPRWFSTAAEVQCSWSQLLAEHGPVVLVHEPDAPLPVTALADPGIPTRAEVLR